MHIVCLIKKRLFQIFFILSIVYSCNSNDTSTQNLSLALKLSGENKEELMRVLKYYSEDPKDSLKLKAAKFLISNMIYHYSVSGEYIANHIRLTDSLYSDVPTLTKTFYYQLPFRIDSHKNSIRFERDLNNVTADFLIKNIDYSFKLWESEIIDKVSFDIFCEYILPYKAYYEPLILWKDSSLFEYYNISDLDNYKLDISTYISYINTIIPSFDLVQPDRFEDTLISN